MRMKLYLIVLLIALLWFPEAKSFEFKLKRGNDRQSNSTNQDFQATWAAYWQHLREHGKTVSAINLFSKLQHFQRNAQFIKNAASEDHTFTMGLNYFADWSPDEHKLLLGARVPATRDGNQETGEEAYFKQTVPDSVDWRPYLGPMKNQGNCGACWAFAATALMEYQFGRKLGQTNISLSEQQLIDCSGVLYGNYGCNGGFYTGAWDYIKNAPGSSQTSAYPYRGANGWFCFYRPSSSLGTVSSWQWVVANNEDLLKKTVALQGPVAVAIHVMRDLFYYTGGVYNGACSSNANDANHAVVIVGYGTLKEVPFWIIRNSWGSNWGYKGYFLLQRGVNKCGVANWAAYVVSK